MATPGHHLTARHALVVLTLLVAATVVVGATALRRAGPTAGKYVLPTDADFVPVLVRIDLSLCWTPADDVIEQVYLVPTTGWATMPAGGGISDGALPSDCSVVPAGAIRLMGPFHGTKVKATDSDFGAPVVGFSKPTGEGSVCCPQLIFAGKPEEIFTGTATQSHSETGLYEVPYVTSAATPITGRVVYVNVLQKTPDDVADMGSTVGLLRLTPHGRLAEGTIVKASDADASIENPVWRSPIWSYVDINGDGQFGTTDVLYWDTVHTSPGVPTAGDIRITDVKGS